MKINCEGCFFENKLLLQPDVVFDSESNDRDFSTLAPPGCEKKIFAFFKSKIVVFFLEFGLSEKKSEKTPTSDVILKKKRK